jgi:carboxypeptidase Taq
LANQAWIAAREQGDFALFLPHLETLMDVNRRYAFAVKTDRHAHPYDALLELYEPGEY